MSTIKSSDEHLTLNADGSSKDIKFQANGVEKASISSTGVMTATSFAGSGAALTGVGVAGITSAADATAITIDSSENVGVGKASALGATLHIDPAANVTTSYGSPLVKVGGDNSWAGNGSIYSIGFGYTNGATVKAPVEVGMETTSASGVTNGSFVVATRNGTTDAAPTERMRIDSSGYVLANKMATSYATLQGPSGNSNHTGSNYNIMRVVENPDSLYNSSNGRFTCPVDGLYFMSAMSINTYSINGTIQAIPKKNGTEILGVGRMYEHQDHNHGGSAASGVVRCDSGDYLQWDWSGSIYDGPHSSASFALIHGET